MEFRYAKLRDSAIDILLLGRFLPVPSSEAFKQALYPGHPLAQASHIPVNAGDVSLQVPQEGSDSLCRSEGILPSKLTEISFEGGTPSLREALRIKKKPE